MHPKCCDEAPQDDLTSPGELCGSYGTPTGSMEAQ
jgi:hypothetical protein